jgi:NAD+ synthase (glutamine-hydrolysing)
MRLALAQINTVVGDLDGNAERIGRRLAEAKEQQADLVVFPELAVTGYPPEDLLLRPSFVQAAQAKAEALAREARGIVALIGVPWFDRDLYNACAICAAGEIKTIYRKRFLPNYGVFDEDRYFATGRDLVLLEHGGTLVGPTICEDMWQPGPPATDLALAGAQLLVNLSASPFHLLRDRERQEMFATRARDNSCLVAFCNSVGGQDELLFDGNSLVLDEEGHLLARGPSFEEALVIVDIEPADAIGRRLRDVRRRALARDRRALPDLPAVHVGSAHGPRERVEALIAPRLDELEQMRVGLELGLRDYVDKNGFGEVVVGVSGGIDSALTAALAVEALGPLRVHCVSMPSRYSSAATREDARRLAANLGADFRELPIDDIYNEFESVLAESFAALEHDLTEENLQARIRGTTLMALSNKFGWLVVATGNKSELSVGYATLYGDLAGGFALIKDVFKTDVFRLARYLNERAGEELIRRRSATEPRPRSCGTTNSTRIRCRPIPPSTRCSPPTSRKTAPPRS